MMTTGFWRLSSSTVQQRWSLMAAIAVVIKGKAKVRQLQGGDEATEMRRQLTIMPAQARLIEKQQSTGVDEREMMGTMGWIEETCSTWQQQ